MAKMGGARTFFTVYASIKSEQILDDANALGAVMTAVFTDAIEGMMIPGKATGRNAAEIVNDCV